MVSLVAAVHVVASKPTSVSTHFFTFSGDFQSNSPSVWEFVVRRPAHLPPRPKWLIAAAAAAAAALRHVSLQAPFYAALRWPTRASGRPQPDHDRIKSGDGGHLLIHSASLKFRLSHLPCFQNTPKKNPFQLRALSLPPLKPVPFQTFRAPLFVELSLLCLSLFLSSLLGIETIS